MAAQVCPVRTWHPRSLQALEDRGSPGPKVNVDNAHSLGKWRVAFEAGFAAALRVKLRLESESRRRMDGWMDGCASYSLSTGACC